VTLSEYRINANKSLRINQSQVESFDRRICIAMWIKDNDSLILFFLGQGSMSINDLFHGYTFSASGFSRQANMLSQLFAANFLEELLGHMPGSKGTKTSNRVPFSSFDTHDDG
jgi:hypothetical protein